MREFAGVALAVSLAVCAGVAAKSQHLPAVAIPVLQASSATVQFVQTESGHVVSAAADWRAGTSAAGAWNAAAARIESIWTDGVNAVGAAFGRTENDAARTASAARIVAANHPLPKALAIPIRPRAGAASPAPALVALPRARPARPLALAVKVAPAPLPPNATAVAPAAPQTVVPDPALAQQEAGLVAARLLGLVPAKLMPYFDLFFYVSKAPEGPWAQRLFIFHKAADGTLAFEDSFSISTGREREEKYFTATPAGLFELDPGRFEPMHYSHTWDDAKMPWSMFFNYIRHGEKVGIALHAAVGRREDNDLGHRASGGCVRLPLERADTLYHRIQAEERGQVPIFAVDPARNTSSVTGEIATDGQGRDLLAAGYKTLVVIDDYAGASPGVAISQNLLGIRAQTRLALTSVNRKTAADWNKSACFG